MRRFATQERGVRRKGSVRASQLIPTASQASLASQNPGPFLILKIRLDLVPEDWSNSTSMPTAIRFGASVQSKSPNIKMGLLCASKWVVPKIRVEPSRVALWFLSLVRVVLISVIRRDLVQAPEYSPLNVRA